LVGAMAGGDEHFEVGELAGEGFAGGVVPVDDALGGVAAADEEDAPGAGGLAAGAGHFDEEAAGADGDVEAAGRGELQQPAESCFKRGALVVFVGEAAGEDEGDVGGPGASGFGQRQMRAGGRVPGGRHQGHERGAGRRSADEFHAIIVAR